MAAKSSENWIKSFLHQSLYEAESRSFIVTSDILAGVTIISILGIVLETVPSLSKYFLFFYLIEILSVAIFTVEYVARIYVVDNKRSYIFSFFGIIDLLAILPTYFGVGNWTFLKSVRVLRILRFLRMLRLAKILRLRRKRGRDLEEFRDLYRINLQVYFFSLTAVILIFGSLIYVLEGGKGAFDTIPHGMLWAAKVVLGGIPSVVPESTEGEILSAVARFAGLVLFGLLINVIGASIKRLVFGSGELLSEEGLNHLRYKQN